MNNLSSKLLVAIFISASENRRHSSSGKAEEGFALFPDVLNNFETPSIGASVVYQWI